jgi:hypothetical protein
LNFAAAIELGSLREVTTGVELMTLLKKSLLAAAAGTAVLTLSAVSASADIACVTVVCWHTTDRYEYPTESRVVVHENTWKPDAD